MTFTFSRHPESKRGEMHLLRHRDKFDFLIWLISGHRLMEILVSVLLSYEVFEIFLSGSGALCRSSPYSGKPHMSSTYKIHFQHRAPYC